MGYKKMQELTNIQNDSEMLLKIAEDNGGFLALLNCENTLLDDRSGIRSDWVAKIMELLRKAVQYKGSPATVISFINQVCASRFMATALDKYLKVVLTTGDDR